MYDIERHAQNDKALIVKGYIKAHVSNNKLGLSRLVFIPVTIEFSGIRSKHFGIFADSEVRSLQHTAEMTHLCSMKSGTSREDLKGWRLFTCLGADIA